MSLAFLHGRWRRQLSLLASGALEGAERQRAENHLAGCERCRRELAELRQLLRLVASDPLSGTAPRISAPALVARVRSRIEAQPPAEPALVWTGLMKPAVAALAVMLAVGALWRTEPPREEPRIHVSDAFLNRLERNLAREQAARYLDEAQDVLVTVAARPRNCDRDERLDVGDEAERSRQLLARAALLVERDRADVASVLPVLEDVDNVLREVATLPACARRRDLDAIHRTITERHLLMKIPLMSRELRG
jgi:hypothetical protein